MDGTTGDGTSLREMLAQGDRIATHRCVRVLSSFSSVDSSPPGLPCTCLQVVCEVSESLCVWRLARFRNEDLFRELDGRGLTETELGIIAQRVALQRSMAEVFERRERARKARAARREPATFRGGGSCHGPEPAPSRGKLPCCAATPGDSSPHRPRRPRNLTHAPGRLNPPLSCSQLREIKTVCPDATDDEALAALMDKEGKCVARARGACVARMGPKSHAPAASLAVGGSLHPAHAPAPFSPRNACATSEDEAALALSDPEYRQALQQNLRPVRQAAARGASLPLSLSCACIASLLHTVPDADEHPSASRQAPVTHARRKPAPVRFGGSATACLSG